MIFAFAAVRCGMSGTPQPAVPPVTLRDASPDVPSDAPPESPRDAGLIPRPTRCGADDQAPLRGADGSPTCTHVGAQFEAQSFEWPDEGDAGVIASAIRYVRAGADAASADGTRAHPFAGPAAALASLPSGEGAVVIAAGGYVITAPLVARAPVLFVGAGPSSEGGTVFEAGAATVVRASGSAARVTLRGLLIRGTSVSSDGGAASASIVAEVGAALRVENVAILQPGVGVLAAENSRFSAERLTIRQATEHGVLATGGSVCDLRDVLIRDGAGRGIEARESYLQLHRALIHENADIGVAIRGNTALDPLAGASRCTPDGPSSERGASSCLSYASITCNGVAAVFAQGLVRVTGSRLALSGTRVVASMPGGDGLVVKGGAIFDLDPDATAMGAGSELVGNARAGALVQEEGSTLSMRAALVGGNEGPGLFIGLFATVSRVVSSEFAFNTGIGVAVGGNTSLLELRDSVIRDTRMGALPGIAESIGDGLSVGAAALGMVVNNEFSGNPRYAGVFAGATGTITHNFGTGNRFSLYAWPGSGVVISATNHVSGSAGEGRPAVTPTGL